MILITISNSNDRRTVSRLTKVLSQDIELTKENQRFTWKGKVLSTRTEEETHFYLHVRSFIEKEVKKDKVLSIGIRKKSVDRGHWTNTEETLE